MRPAPRWLGSACLAACTMAQATAAMAKEDFSLYVTLPLGTTELHERYGRNISALIDWDEGPFDVPGMRVVYAGWLGEYPFAGVHLVEEDPNYMSRHFDAMRKNLHRWVPEGYDGILIIDYETWWASWDHTRNVPSLSDSTARDFDFKDDWRDYIERHRPEVIAGKTGDALERALRDSYEEAAMRFLIETLRECKRLRPDAKWGYFNYPKLIYRSPFTASGTIGYGDHSHYASEINDRLAPLWAEMDVTGPRLFAPRRTIPGPLSDPLVEQTPEHQRMFIMSHIAEAKRVAPHALCVPLVSTRYFGKPELDGYLNELSTRTQFEFGREAGAEGMMVWGGVHGDIGARDTADYINHIAMPIARELWAQWYPEAHVRSEITPTSGGAMATTAPIPLHLRIRYSRTPEGGEWKAIRQGATRISVPSHSPSSTISAPVYRGGRIVARRATPAGGE